MGLQVHFRGGPKAGEITSFDDSVTRITIGREPQRCQVVFPPDDTRVGREHFAVEREVGRYRLVLNNADVVLLNGRRAVDGQELPDRADIQLGKKGPELVLITTYDGKLPGTEGRVVERGAATRLLDAERTARSGRRLALLTALVLLLAAPGGYYAWKAIDASINEAVDAVEDTTDERLQAVLEKARPSIYLVYKRSTSGNIDPMATAWSLDPKQGIFGTNSHVAANFRSLRSDQKLMVRSSGDDPRDFEVTSVEMHPGYNEFIDTWRAYDPAVRTSPVRLERVGSPGPACDVALMYVANPEGMAPGLELASDEEINKIEAGYPVAYAGFPMEGLALGGVNVNAPVPASYLGRVIRRTNYFDTNRLTDGERELVQHTLPVAGGASGSPMLNADGRVVAVVSGMDVIGKASEGRIGSSAQTGFAQRVDLIRELVDQSAQRHQAARTQTWKTQIAKHYGRYDELEKAVAMQQLFEGEYNKWLEDLEESERNDVKTSEIARVELKLPADTTGTRSVFQTVKFPTAGDALIVAASNERIELSVLYLSDSGNRRLDGTGENGKCRAARAVVSQGSSCEIRVSSEDPGDVVITCYQADVHKIDMKQRIEQQATKWLQRIRETVSRRAEQVTAYEATHRLETQRDGRPMARVKFENQPAGSYLLVAVPADSGDLDCVIGKLSGNDQFDRLSSDYFSRAWCTTDFILEQPGTLEASVFGSPADAEFALRLYRAETK